MGRPCLSTASWSALLRFASVPSHMARPGVTGFGYFCQIKSSSAAGPKPGISSTPKPPIKRLSQSNTLFYFPYRFYSFFPLLLFKLICVPYPQFKQASIRFTLAGQRNDVDKTLKDITLEPMITTVETMEAPLALPPLNPPPERSSDV